MAAWLPDVWMLHLTLLVSLGLMLTLWPSLRTRPALQGRRGTALAAVLGLTWIVMGLDAWWRDLPLPFRMFPWVFLGLFVFFRGPTGALVVGAVQLVIAGLRSPRLQTACFTAALMGLFAVLASTPLAPEECFALASDDALLRDHAERIKDVDVSPFRTDRDRVVRVMAYDAAGTPLLEKSLRILQRTLLERWGLADQVMALPMTWLPCNCHGYVFAHGQFVIPSEEVDAILEDNGYAIVSQPKMGDVIVYRDKDGKVVHSGTVRGRGDGITFIESKWGKLGRFLHPHTVWAQADVQSAFYRSSRRGHALASTPGAVPIDVAREDPSVDDAGFEE